MSRHISICDWLPPDFGAVGQYALADARRRAREGHEVTLIGLTSSESSVEEEPIGTGRLRVIRHRAPTYDRSSFVRRALWTASANRKLVAEARRHAAWADEIQFSGAPPLLLHWIAPALRRFEKPLVYRITDFHPECLVAERSHRGLPPFWLRLLLQRTLRLRHLVDRFEVLGEDQRRRLLEIGIAPERVELRRDEAPVSFDPLPLPLPIPPTLAGRVTLLYSGNFGVAHEDATFVSGYERHHRTGSGRVAIWLNATGAKADSVEAELRRRDLPFHRSRPVALDELARLLVTPHAHLITLRDAFVGYVLPSKVYGCIASGREVLFVGSTGSDVDLLCRERCPDRYRRVEVGDSDGVARALEAIADTAEKRDAGARAAPAAPAIV